MRAVVKVSEESGAAGTAVRDVSVPEPGPGQVRVRVVAAGICGSDRHIFHWDPSIRHMIRLPRVYGHEFCGIVDRIGAEVQREDLSEGDFVSAEMHITCGTCRACQHGQRHVCHNTKIVGFHFDGTFAEYVIVPATNIVRLDPDVVPPKVGAFLDALGNAVHTVQDYDLEGMRVAVLGYGPIGAMATAIADHVGVERAYVLDVMPKALDQARAWVSSRHTDVVTVVRTGGDATADATQRILDETNGGVDLVLEMSGAEAAINQGLRIVRGGGSLSMLGIPGREAVTIERFARDFVYKGSSMNAISGRRVFSTWDRMLELLADGLQVEDLVSHEYEDLEAFPDAMQAFDAHEALKVVLYPQGKNGRV